MVADNSLDREYLIKTFEAIIWVTDARRAIRVQRARAIASQIARTALENLRRPRIVNSGTNG